MSEDGKKQAELAGLALSGVAFDKIYASDLERAYETAIIISQKNQVSSNIASDKNHNIVEANELLRERCFGILELRPHKEFVAAAENSGFVRGKNTYDFIPEGAESLSDVKERAKQFLNMVFKSYTNNGITQSKKCNVLIASHSGFLRQVATYLIKDCDCNLPGTIESKNDEDVKSLLEKAVKNTAISTYEVHFDTTKNEIISVDCVRYGCIRHLESGA